MNTYVDAWKYSFAELASKVDCDRRDSSFTRTKDGVVLSEISSDAIVRNYGSTYARYANIILSPCRTFFINENNEMILNSRVLRDLPGFGTPMQRLVTYFTFPNGQVKNFLNACRASCRLRDEARICVIGSKASEGSGLWHKYFALYLAQRCTRVWIDFFDYNEKNAEWDFAYQGVEICCNWHARPVVPSDIESADYNCVIDDAWSYEQGPGVLTQTMIENYSLKGGREAYVPFLHPNETRKFSCEPYAGRRSTCQCMVCRVCESVSETYDEYLYVRAFCSRLGCPHPCLGTNLVTDLNVLAKLHSDLLRSPQLKLSGPSVWRFVMALTEEVAIGVSDDLIWKEVGEPKFRAYRRFKALNSKDKPATEIFSWLRGKSVLFVGVDSAILGATEICMAKGSAYSSGVDVVFASSPDVFALNPLARSVYVPVPSEGLVGCLGWAPTGRSVKKYFEYCREQVHDVPTPEPVLSQRVGNLYYPSVALFPDLDATVVGGPLKSRHSLCGDRVNCLLFSVVRLQYGTRVVEFDPSLWRSSIWYLDGDWGLLCEDVVLLSLRCKDFSYSTFIDLPWDCSPNELRSFEKKRSACQSFVQTFLRQCYFKGTILTDSDLLQDRNGSTVRQWINRQREFGVLSAKGGYRLIIRQGSHPAGAVYSMLGKQREELSGDYVTQYKLIGGYVTSAL